MTHISDMFVDPDIVGEAEYRVIYETLEDVWQDLHDHEADTDPAQKVDTLIAVLNEFISSAEALKRRARVWKQRVRQA
jgi:hypothetical protein